MTMIRKNQHVVRGSLAAAVAFLLIHSVAAFAESVVRVQLDDPWQVGYASKTPTGSIMEWTLNGQSVENWTQLLTLNQFKSVELGFRPSDFLALSIARFKQTTKAKYAILKETPTEVVLEVNYPANNGFAAEYGLHRWFLNEEGVYNIQYASKTPIPESAKSKWIKALSQAKAIRADNQPY